MTFLTCCSWRWPSYAKRVKQEADILEGIPKYLGYAGLAPPAFLLAAVAADPTLVWLALAAGFGYSAVIFSFLGGIWWGQALRARRAPSWIWFAAVAPALISFILFVPWIFGWDWPRPALVALAIFILLSPIVDYAARPLMPMPKGWLSLRVQLSLGLACLTFILSRI
jgi:hypothetical protein